MDHGGVSIISAKTTENNVTSVYNNLAFSPDDLAKADGLNKGVTDNININISNGDTTTVPLNNINEKNVDDVTSAKNTDDILNSKKGPPSVDFTMPEKEHREAPKSTTSDAPYRGMGKEELLRYSSQPLWRNLRYVVVAAVLCGWLALLVTVLALVLTYPQCRAGQERQWWQKAVVYRVYVRSFMDGDQSDGEGDIRGVAAQLDYIQSTGANTVSLSPFYKLSQGAPTDTHIVDHKDVDSIFGTLEDFRHLVNETHARGMHITVDFIPNHTSDEHPWFRKSSGDSDPRNNEYRSYYVWKEGAKPYNNWQSVHGCSAWESVPLNGSNTQQSYLHQFMQSQPDLNIRSDKVKDELLAILEFWLNEGVDGFYIRDADFLFEDYDFRDDVLNDVHDMINCSSGLPAYAYSAYNHTYTRGETQNLDIIAHWRSYLDDYGNATNRYRILMTDVDGNVDHVMSYYGLFNRDGVDFPLNTFSRDIDSGDDGQDLADIIISWTSYLEAGHWPNWMSGDDRSHRLADRLGRQLAKSYLLFITLLPGTPFIYYGDEIGLTGATIPRGAPDYFKSMRAPMPWSNISHHHGFCLNGCMHTWMNQSTFTHQSPNTGSDLVTGYDVLAMQNNFDSIYNLFKNATELRKDNPSFIYGDYIMALRQFNIVSFVREFDGERGYLIAINFGPSKQAGYFTGSHSTIPGSGKVELISGNKSGIVRGQSIGLSPLTLGPEESVVVSWDYEAKEL